jgi:hypothetical protein
MGVLGKESKWKFSSCEWLSATPWSDIGERGAYTCSSTYLGLYSRWGWSTPCPRDFACRRLRLKYDDTRTETRFRLSAKRTSPFKSAGASVQSTAGSRGVRISGSNAGYTMFRGSVNSTGYPLHSAVSPSLPLPCVTVCHHISTGVYPLDKRLMDTEPVWMLWRKISCLSPDSSVFLLVACSLYGLSWRFQRQSFGLGGLSLTRLRSMITQGPRRYKNRITFQGNPSYKTYEVWNVCISPISDKIFTTQNFGVFELLV